MNIDFATFCLISVPGFLIGIMTGRFIEGSRWQETRRNWKISGKIMSSLFLLAYFLVTLVVLGIMAVYLLNMPDSANPINFWIVLILGLWMLINLYFELRDLFRP